MSEPHFGLENDATHEVGDVDLFNLSAFPCVEHRHSDVNDFTVDLLNAPTFLSHRHSFSKYLTIELWALEEMTKALVDLFGLTLPPPRQEQPSASPAKASRLAIFADSFGGGMYSAANESNQRQEKTASRYAFGGYPLTAVLFTTKSLHLKERR